MKRYSVSRMRIVNRDSSKSGLMYQYDGRTDNPQEVIDAYNKTKIRCTRVTYPQFGGRHFNGCNIGIKITDSTTKEVIFCDARISDADEMEKYIDEKTQICDYRKTETP